MKLKEIHRTSTFAWSPSSSLPLLATGSVAGALDESFSNESHLELWAPDFLDKNEFVLGSEGQGGPKGTVTDNARFNRLAWGSGAPDASYSRGVLAAGMENGELALWDPAKILEGVESTEALILRNTTHTGPVRGLDFNPINTNLLSSGAVNGEVYIWDLKDPSHPYAPTPGTRSSRLDEITSVAWNQQVPHVLASSSSTGYTVVWDLRGRREVAALSYGGGAGTLSGHVVGGAANGLAVGGRRGMSDIAWHPDQATRLVTASEDDSSPVIMVWDLRNARAPEKILTGHEKGVLSLSWCKQDADLLLSCGKDNRALCWNPQTSEIIGELPSADNWAFQVDWCPRNPDLLATAFFDGTIGIHSIQSTNEAAASTSTAVAKTDDGADVFDAPGFSRSSSSTLSLKQPPKWLRRPASTSFGFGGQLVSVSNLPSAQGKNQSSVVHLRKITSEKDIVDRAKKLKEAIDNQALNQFAQEKSSGISDDSGEASWKALLSLFHADSRDELVTLLGFSKTEIAARVAEAVAKLKSTAENSAANRAFDVEEDITDSKPHEPVVSFVEPEKEVTGDDSSADGEKTPSEVSASATSDTTSAARPDGESTTTVPSLFGDDDAGPGTPHEGADFFSTMGVSQDDGSAAQVLVPHTSYGVDSSVAATIGSRPSSAASESLKNNGFKIYPSDESETDRLVTKALVLGDFDSAVSLCLSSDRFADAILLAVKGGPELLERTQKAYFERRTSSYPYLRLFQSIVTNDLSDIVQNADLQEWQEIFVVLCTFASQEEFSALAEQLGSRLEFQYALSRNEDRLSSGIKVLDDRKNATLTYLAAGRLERLVNIWLEELAEEEKRLLSADEQAPASSAYSAHAHALQTFIEKVTVFRSAIKYVDADLASTSGEDSVAKTYKLATLYDRYFEYAEVLAAQGLVKDAVVFLKLTPSDYKGFNITDDLSAERERLLKSVDATPAPALSLNTSAATSTTVPVNKLGPTMGQYSQYNAPAQPVHSLYTPAGAPEPIGYNTGYTPATSAYQPPAPSYNPAGGYNAMTQPPHLRTQPPMPSPAMIPPPPRVGSSMGASAAPPPPPPKRQDNGGWNDAPAVIERRGGSTTGNKAVNAIVSPFPNSSPASPYMSPAQSQPSMLPPPPRPGSVQAQNVPPPPQGQGHRQVAPPPPGRLMSPPQGGTLPPPPQRQPTPGGAQYARPPSAAAVGPYAPSQLGHQPQGPYARNTPPPQQQQQSPSGPYAPTQQGRAPPPAGGPYTPSMGPGAAPPQPTGPYAPAQQAPTGPYAPPPGAQQVHPPPGGGPPPPPGGPSAGGPPRPSAPPVRKGPPPPKYPPGDRSHIPEHVKPAYEIISGQLNQLRQVTPSSQKRLVDDLERRINPLFDALNCETLSKGVVDQLLVLVNAMNARDRAAALAIHVDMLTRGSGTDDIGLWMSGIKQLIMRL